MLRMLFLHLSSPPHAALTVLKTNALSISSLQLRVEQLSVTVLMQSDVDFSFSGSVTNTKCLVSTLRSTSK